MAQFPDHTPLYPVCRAWMKNDPHNTNMAPRLRTPTPEPRDEPMANGNKEDDANSDDLNDEMKQIEKHVQEITQKDPDIYKLPAPNPLETGENGETICVRIPNILREPITKDLEVKVIIIHGF